MGTPQPDIDELKIQARRLRQAMAERGTGLTHAAALELVARQHGVRDWNTLSARSATKPAAPPPPVAVGDHVRGRYLNQPFAGTVLSLSTLPGGDLSRVVIHFDEPVDVVTFESFSAFRRRISATVDAAGISPRRTSDGVPHLSLDR